MRIAIKALVVFACLLNSTATSSEVHITGIEAKYLDIALHRFTETNPDLEYFEVTMSDFGEVVIVVFSHRQASVDSYGSNSAAPICEVRIDKRTGNVKSHFSK
jgi:hypothetical protein